MISLCRPTCLLFCFLGVVFTINTENARNETAVVSVGTCTLVLFKSVPVILQKEVLRLQRLQACNGVGFHVTVSFAKEECDKNHALRQTAPQVQACSSAMKSSLKAF